MCNPIAVYTVASMVFTAYSSSEQSRSAKNIAKFNARESENEAVRTRNAGTEQEIAHRQKVAQLQSEQRAQLGAANVDINSGSALDIQEDARLLGEVDSLRIRSNFGEKASSLDRSATLSIAEGNNNAAAIRNKGIGSILSQAGAGISASGVASKWYNPTSRAVTTTVTGAQANSQFGNIA